MAISATSTIAEIEAEYVSNSNYEATGSITEAYACLRALRVLRIKRSQNASLDARSMGYEEIASEMKTVMTFIRLSRNASTGCEVRHFDFNEGFY